MALRAPHASVARTSRALILFVAYVLTARAGVELWNGNGCAGAVWVPSGLALAAMLRWGRGLWPAVLAGAAVAAALDGAPALAVAAIGIGATAEAAGAAWLLARVPDFRPQLDRVHAVLWLIVTAGIAALLAAGLGTGGLLLGDAIDAGAAFGVAKERWLADVGGVLLVGAALLVFGTSTLPRPRGRTLGQTAAAFVVLLTFGFVLLAGAAPASYPMILGVVLVALAFGQHAAVIASLAVAAMCVGFTAADAGPFAPGPAADDLLEAQLFACVCALSSLLVAAARSERRETERRLAEQEIGAAERARAVEQTRAIVDTAHDAFVSIDAEGHVQDWNHQAELTFGWRRDEMLGRALTDTIVPPAFRARHEAGLQRFLTTGESAILGQRLEMSALRSDGREIPVELTINPVASASGWGFTAFLHDISERRDRERRLDTEYAVGRLLARDGLAESEVAGVLTVLGEGMGWQAALWWSVDPASRRMRCIAGFHAEPERTAGLERVSRGAELGPDDELPGPALAAARGLGLQGHTALPLLGGDEVVGFFEVFTTAQWTPGDDDTRLVLGLCDRIGQQVLRAHTREAIDELAQHFETSQDLLCSAGADGCYRSLNRRWEEVLGFTEDELRAAPILDFIHPDDRALVLDVAEGFADGRHTACDFRARHRHRDGSWRMIAWSANVSPDGVMYGSGRDVTDRLASEQELQLQAEIARNMAEGVLLVRTSDWTVVYANHKLAEIFGYGPGELEGRPVSLLAVPLPPDAPRPPVQSALQETGAYSGEIENLRKDGSRFWSHVNISNFQHPEHGEVSVAVHSDVTAAKVAHEALAAAEQRFRRAFEDAGAGMALLGVRGEEAGRFMEVNDALCRIIGHSRERLMGTSLADLLHVDDLAASAEGARRLLAGELDTYQAEKRLLDADGRVVWVTLSTSIVRDHQGEPLHRIAHVQDISERKRFEGQLQHLADHDSLTGLFNRRRFEEELGRELVAARRYGTGGAVLVLDVDNFKYVNDSLGHAAGDELIAKVGRLVADRVRDSDIVARLGGDEFAVILPHADEAEARLVAQELVEVIREEARVMTDAGSRRVSVSIGLSLLREGPDHHSTSEDLLVEADIAMYDAKEAGRDQIAVFDAAAERHARGQAHLTWADRIREALEEDRFELHAQPIVALGAGAPATRRFELLIRMRDADGDLVPPNTFLPVAERTNLILDIDRWVVRRGIGLLAEQQRAGLDVCFELNLSAKSIVDPATADLVARELAATGVDPRGLVFEITETAAIVNVDRARAFAARLHELGCRFALDDFGAGFASFHYLKHLDFDYLKIDGEFIQELASSRTNRLVVRAVVEMARGLGKATIAEYVEDAETVALLTDWGVDFAQGFHCGRPAPPASFGLREWPGGAPGRQARQTV